MKFEAILFDCDGVLRDMLEEGGWSLSPDECMRVFVGKAVRDERLLIEARTGQPLTEDWMAEFYARRNRELRARLQAIAGAHEADQFQLCLRPEEVAADHGSV